MLMFDGHALTPCAGSQFAATACTIVSGAIAERARFEAYILYSLFMAAWVYPILTHSGTAAACRLCSSSTTTASQDELAGHQPLGIYLMPSLALQDYDFQASQLSHCRCVFVLTLVRCAVWSPLGWCGMLR